MSAIHELSDSLSDLFAQLSQKKERTHGAIVLDLNRAEIVLRQLEVMARLARSLEQELAAHRASEAIRLRGLSVEREAIRAARPFAGEKNAGSNVTRLPIVPRPVPKNSGDDGGDAA